MAVVTYNVSGTTLDKECEAYELLQEINERIGNKLIIHEDHFTTGFWWFKKTKVINYRIFWDLDGIEFQHIMMGHRLNYAALMCYLLGILTGMDKQRRLQEDKGDSE